MTAPGDEHDQTLLGRVRPPDWVNPEPAAARRGWRRRRHAADAAGQEAARPLARLAAVMRAAMTLVAMLAIATTAGGASPAIEVGRFAAPAEPAALPAGWEPLTFKKIPRVTRYTVVRDGEGWVLKAESDASASGLYRPLDVDPRAYPRLTWRWKVGNVLVKGDARRKEGDDYPARIYVAFRYDPAGATTWEKTKYGAYRLLHGTYPPRAVLNYIWDNRLPPGTTLDNAYTDRARMIVVRSGTAEVGRWLTETRNVLEDYRRAFGGEPPHIAGVAVMTDTDDTGERAVAWYDAITLLPPE